MRIENLTFTEALKYAYLGDAIFRRRDEQLGTEMYMGTLPLIDEDGNIDVSRAGEGDEVLFSHRFGYPRPVQLGGIAIMSRDWVAETTDSSV